MREGEREREREMRGGGGKGEGDREKERISTTCESTTTMNAQECRTLTATRMHDSSTCRSIAYLSMYACSISGVYIELDTYYHIHVMSCT